VEFGRSESWIENPKGRNNKKPHKTLIPFVVSSAVVFGLLAMPSPAFAASSEKVLYSFCASVVNYANGAPLTLA
jgi:hypothetical protein